MNRWVVSTEKGKPYTETVLSTDYQLNVTPKCSGKDKETMDLDFN
jgi:hypothetical protein